MNTDTANLRLLASSALMVVSLPLAAQQNAVTAPAVEVTAYRVPVLLSETAQGTTVITKQEIADRAPSSMVDLLQQIPGVQVDQVGSPGGVANVYIRGSDPEHVLVLIDGVRVNDPMLSRGGSYDLSSLDPATIERIEVIRGAGSAIYGADAMGGVINIVTRREAREGAQLSVGAGAGGQDYRSAHTRASGGGARVQYNLNASRLEDGREEDGGELEVTAFDGGISFRPVEALDVRLFARRNDRDSSGFPDTSGGIRLATIRTLESREAEETTYGTGLTFAPTEPLSLRLQASRYERDEDIDSPGVAPGPGNPFGLPATVSRTEFRRDVALLSATRKLPLNSDLTIGYERMKESGDSRSTIAFIGPADFALERDTDSVFVAAKSKPVDRLTVLLDVRHDRVSGLESELSPGAGVRYDFATGTSLKARYSEGFRPPSFFSLGHPLVGNPALKSETSRSGELGIEQAWGGTVHAGAALFRTRYKNLIDFDPTIPPFGLLVNRSTVDARGFEAQASVRPIQPLVITLGYTHVDTDIVDSNDELRNRPEDRASLSVGYALSEAWRINWNTVYVGEVFDFSVPMGTVTLSAYTRSDVALSYTRKAFTATFAVDNVFDRQYEQFVGFEHPGARARLAVAATF